MVGDQAFCAKLSAVMRANTFMKKTNTQKRDSQACLRVVTLEIFSKRNT